MAFVKEYPCIHKFINYNPFRISIPSFRLFLSPSGYFFISFFFILFLLLPLFNLSLVFFPLCIPPPLFFLLLYHLFRNSRLLFFPILFFSSITTLFVFSSTLTNYPKSCSLIPLHSLKFSISHLLFPISHSHSLSSFLTFTLLHIRAMVTFFH